MSASPRPIRPPVPLVRHGAITPTELRALGQRLDEVIDFSVNINPYGPTPEVREAVTAVEFGRYPDPDAILLREALAQKLARRTEELLIGNGAGELIWLTAFAYLQAGDRALIIGPTYGEYARSVALVGAKPVWWTAHPHDNFSIHPRQINMLLNEKPKVVFLCHPNNPTGRLFPLMTLETWLNDFPEMLFVVDEAYLDFVEEKQSALQIRASNLLVLRSMTKAQALAGLRLGYAVGAKAVIHALKQVQTPWSVNAIAQTAGLTALRDKTHLSSQVHRLHQAKAQLMRDLRELGFRPMPSDAHYFLLPVDDGAQFRRKLLRHGIVVRDASSFGLPGFVRIATRRPEENKRLIEAIKNEQC